MKANLVDTALPGRVRGGVDRVRALQPDDAACDAELRALVDAVLRQAELLVERAGRK